MPLLLALLACARPAPTAGDVTACAYAGVVYAPGDRFPADDTCNHCLCEADGGVSCTERACEPMWEEPLPGCDVIPCGEQCGEVRDGCGSTQDCGPCEDLEEQP